MLRETYANYSRLNRLAIFKSSFVHTGTLDNFEAKLMDKESCSKLPVRIGIVSLRYSRTNEKCMQNIYLKK